MWLLLLLLWLDPCGREVQEKEIYVPTYRCLVAGSLLLVLEKKLILKPSGERRQRAIVKQEPRLSRTRNIATIGCRPNGLGGVVGCGERSHFCASEFPTNRKRQDAGGRRWQTKETGGVAQHQQQEWWLF